MLWLGGRWPSCVASALFQVVQNSVNYLVLGDERDDLHFGDTFWAEQRVGLIDPSNQIGPPAPEV